MRGQRSSAVALAFVILATAACSQDPPDERGFPPETPGPTAGGGPGNPGGEGDPTRAQVRLQSVAGGFDRPLFVTHAGDGSERLFVVEQPGTIRIVAGGRVESEPFLDISDRVSSGGEQGLLGLAFPPDHHRTGRFYVDYTDAQGDTVIARYRVGNDRDRADPDSAEVLLRVDQPFDNHNGGGLAFGPDGYLYVSLGDGGSGGDPQGNGQNTGTLLGSLLRLDVSGPGDYRIPPDNPFASGGGKGEIWAYGLRNPWRFSFDRETGDLWIGDVGQDAFEEIDRIPAAKAGVNLGWNVMEGNSCFISEGCDAASFAGPITQYGHSEGCSVTGGYVYRGSDYPVLAGGYFFSDVCSGTLWVIEASGGKQNPVRVLETERAVSSFGEAEDGELYLVDIEAGQLLQVTGRPPD